MDSKQFTQPVSMVCNKKQYEFLSKELEKLGYNSLMLDDVISSSFIFTNMGNINNLYSVDFSSSFKNTNGRIFITEYSAELFLAISAMQSGEHIAGEWIYIEGYRGNTHHEDGIYKLISCHKYEGKLTTALAEANSSGYIYNPNQYRKANLQEIAAKFSYTLTNNELIPMEKEQTLPNNWYVTVTNSNLSVLREWRNCDTLCVGNIVGMTYFNSTEVKKGHNCAGLIKGTGYDFGKEITYEQFKQYIKQTNMEKKIVSYQLKDKKYIDAVNALITISFGGSYKGTNLTAIGNDHSVRLLKEAGVLSLWFNEIYETKEKSLSIQHSEGTIEIVLKEKGQLYIPSENISIPVKSFERILQPREVDIVSSKLWTISVYANKFDIGCKKGIDVSEIQRVVKEHDAQFN